MTEYTVYYDTGRKTTINADNKLAALIDLGYENVNTQCISHECYLPQDVSHVSNPDESEYTWRLVGLTDKARDSYYRWIPVRHGPVMGKYDMSEFTFGRLLCRNFQEIPNARKALENATKGKYHEKDSVTTIGGTLLRYLIQNDLVNSSYGALWTNGLAWKYVNENPHVVLWVFL